MKLICSSPDLFLYESSQSGSLSVIRKSGETHQGIYYVAVRAGNVSMQISEFHQHQCPRRYPHLEYDNQVQ